MNPPTDWTPGLVVLGVAVLAAVVYLVTARRGAAKAAAPTGSEDDLNARYNGILAQLKDHIANKHLLPEAQWATEKARLEQAAAAVLKERENAKHEAVKAQARAEKLQAQAAKAPAGGQLRGAVIGGLVVLFFVGIGYLLSQSTSERKEGMSMTGGVPPGMGGMAGGQEQAQQQPPPDPRLDALFAAVQKSPGDVTALSNLSAYLVRQQDFEEARPFVMQASMLDPYDVPTRVSRTVIEAAVSGDLAGARPKLEHLADAYPDQAFDARLFAGLIALELNDKAGGLAQLEQYLATAPIDDQPPQVVMTVAQLRQEVGTTATP